MKNFFSEFKAFALKGNVMDLAIGVIIAAAFGKIISSLVDNILMPIIGVLLGGQNLDSYAVSIRGVTLKYGLFLNAMLDFVIIAFVLFIMIRVMTKAMKKKAAEPKVDDEKPADIKLLEEIRDALKNR